MRKYDETTLKVAERVFEKGDEILAQRRKRAVKIRHITYAVSGMCAAIIVGFGAWRFSSSVKVPYDSSDIIASTETTTAQDTAVTTAETTTSVTKTTAVTAKSSTAAKTAVITSSAASTAFTATHTRLTTTVKSTAVRTSTLTALSTVTVSATSKTYVSETDIHKTTTKVSLSKGEDDPICTLPENPTGVSHDQTVRTSAVQCTTGKNNVTVTTSNNIESYDIKEIFRTSDATVEVKTDKLNYYVKQRAIVSPDRIDRKRIYMSTVAIKVSDSNTQRYTMEVYDLTDTDRNEAVAVKLFDTNEYYLFTNPSYKKKTSE